MMRKITSLILAFCFLFTQTGLVQAASVELNLSNYFARMTSGMAVDSFRPVHLRYFSYDSLNNSFKVLLDKGDLQKGTFPKGTPSEAQLKEETKELLKYFLIGVTLPNDKFWVNLRPDSPSQIIDFNLEETDIGKIMLEADLQLKKDTALFTSPQTPEGREYWDKLYKKASELYGNENITIPTLTRPWIVPNEIIVRETKDSAYVYKATLKVMLEQDYLKDSTAYSFKDSRAKALNEYSSQLIRELIIPKLTKEVNLSKRYASLRQVYYSLILSRWFKSRFAGSQGLSPKGTVPDFISLIDKNDLTNLTSKTTWDKNTYFNAYKKSFAQGEYNIQEPVYTPSGQTIRSYFSGGINAGSPLTQAMGNRFTAAVPTVNALQRILVTATGNGLELELGGPEITQLAASPMKASSAVGKEPQETVASPVLSLDKLDPAQQLQVMRAFFLEKHQFAWMDEDLLGSHTYMSESELSNFKNKIISQIGPDTAKPAFDAFLKIAKLSNRQTGGKYYNVMVDWRELLKYEDYLARDILADKYPQLKEIINREDVDAWLEALNVWESEFTFDRNNPNFGFKFRNIHFPGKEASPSFNGHIENLKQQYKHSPSRVKNLDKLKAGREKFFGTIDFLFDKEGQLLSDQEKEKEVGSEHKFFRRRLYEIASLPPIQKKKPVLDEFVFNEKNATLLEFMRLDEAIKNYMDQVSLRDDKGYYPPAKEKEIVKNILKDFKKICDLLRFWGVESESNIITRDLYRDIPGIIEHKAEDLFYKYTDALAYEAAKPGEQKKRSGAFDKFVRGNFKVEVAERIATEIRGFDEKIYNNFRSLLPSITAFNELLNLVHVFVFENHDFLPDFAKIGHENPNAVNIKKAIDRSMEELWVFQMFDQSRNVFIFGTENSVYMQFRGYGHALSVDTENTKEPNVVLTKYKIPRFDDGKEKARFLRGYEGYRYYGDTAVVTGSFKSTLENVGNEIVDFIKTVPSPGMKAIRAVYEKTREIEGDGGASSAVGAGKADRAPQATHIPVLSNQLSQKILTLHPRSQKKIRQVRELNRDQMLASPGKISLSPEEELIAYLEAIRNVLGDVVMIKDGWKIILKSEKDKSLEEWQGEFVSALSRGFNERFKTAGEVIAYVTDGKNGFKTRINHPRVWRYLSDAVILGKKCIAAVMVLPGDKIEIRLMNGSELLVALQLKGSERLHIDLMGKVGNGLLFKDAGFPNFNEQYLNDANMVARELIEAVFNRPASSPTSQEDGAKASSAVKAQKERVLADYFLANERWGAFTSDFYRKMDQTGDPILRNLRAKRNLKGFVKGILESGIFEEEFPILKLNMFLNTLKHFGNIAQPSELRFSAFLSSMLAPNKRGFHDVLQEAAEETIKELKVKDPTIEISDQLIRSVARKVDSFLEEEIRPEVAGYIKINTKDSERFEEIYAEAVKKLGIICDYIITNYIDKLDTSGAASPEKASSPVGVSGEDSNLDILEVKMSAAIDKTLEEWGKAANIFKSLPEDYTYDYDDFTYEILRKTYDSLEDWYEDLSYLVKSWRDVEVKNTSILYSLQELAKQQIKLLSVMEERIALENKDFLGILGIFQSSLEEMNAIIHEYNVAWETQRTKPNSPAEDGSSPLGGIDFKSKAMAGATTYEAMGSFSGLDFSLPKLSSSVLLSFNLDKEQADITKAIDNGIIVSGQRIKEFMAASNVKGQLDQRRETVLTWLAKLGILEEITCCTQESSKEYREALVIAESPAYT